MGEDARPVEMLLILLLLLLLLLLLQLRLGNRNAVMLLPPLCNYLYSHD